MNQQPDKFFRDKLQGYEKVVSPGVWSRVSGNLPAKKNNMLWIRIAAGVALLVTASILIIRYPDRTETHVATHTEKPATAPPTRPGDPQQKTQETETESSGGPSKIPNNAAPDSNRRREVPARKESKSATPPPQASNDPAIESLAGPVEKLTEPSLLSGAQSPLREETTMADVAIDEQNKNITIVLTAKEVNERYLKKKNTEVQATSEEKASSGLRKLLDKASDLKHNQDPFGDLRQKKNEILALNFKTSKRNENQ